MNAKPTRSSIAITPVNLASGITCIAFLVSGYWFLRVISPRGYMPASGALGWFCEHARLTFYWPSALQIWADMPRVAWFADYLPLCLGSAMVASFVVRFLWQLFLVPPSASLLDDPYHVVRRSGVDSPRFNHFKDVIMVCPSLDTERVHEDFVAAQMDPYSPAATAIEMNEGPSKEQMALYAKSESDAQKKPVP